MFSLKSFADARQWANSLASGRTQYVLVIVFILLAGFCFKFLWERPEPSPATEKKTTVNATATATDSGPVSQRFDIPPYAGVSRPVENGAKPLPPATPTPPPPLPIALYCAEAGADKEISDTYAPYGRLIPCETIVTIDSARIETPIIGLVTEDVYHEGRLIIPAGAEVHGKAQTDRSRERIASDSQWVIVWRTSDRLNGAELPIKGLALDRERNETSGTWSISDGSAGLKGDIIKTDNLAEIKLFAATFLSAAASGFQDTQSYVNPYTGSEGNTTLTSPKNAALQATSSVINEYARQIQDSIKRDGFYVRVPAGKTFYLYVMQTIDQDTARKGQSQVKDLKSTNTTLNPNLKSKSP